MLTVAISASRTSARIWRQSGLAVPPPDARIWAGAGMPGGDHQVEAVAQAERDALEHRPGQVAPVVAERQPDERAARQRVGVRAALAGEVGQEQQPVAAGGRRSPAAADEVAERARPARARRGTSAGCPRPRASPTSGASGPGTAWQKAWTRPRGLVRAAASVVAKTTPDVPSDSATRARRDRADADGVRGLVAAAGHDRRAGAQAGRRRGVGGDRAGDLRPLERRRQPRRVDPERVERPPATSRGPRGRTGCVPAPSALSMACSPVSRSRT